MQKFFNDRVENFNLILDSSKIVFQDLIELSGTLRRHKSGYTERRLSICDRKSISIKCLPRLFIEYLRKKQRQLISFSSALDTIISYFEKAWKRCQYVTSRNKCEILIVSQTFFLQIILNEILTIVILLFS